MGKRHARVPTMTPRPFLDFRRLKESELVAGLLDVSPEKRQGAFRELNARGEKRGWEAFSLLTRDGFLAGLFASLKNPFDAIGIGVSPETYDRIKTIWNGGTERMDGRGRRELTIDFRHQRLDVVTLDPGAWPPGERFPVGQEGVSRVRFRITDVAAFVERASSVGGDLKGRLTLLPTESASPGGRGVLVHVRAPRGVRTVLVQLVPV